MDTARRRKDPHGPVSCLLRLCSALLIVLFSGVACAPHSYEIRSAEVSPEQYKDLSCAELSAEMNLKLEQLDALGRRIDETAETDETQTAVGVTLFCPVLFWREGSDTPEAQEYARLRGEMLSLEHTATLKECEEASVHAREWYEEERQLREAMEKKRKEQQTQHEYGEE